MPSKNIMFSMIYPILECLGSMVREEHDIFLSNVDKLLSEDSWHGKMGEPLAFLPNKVDTI
jgi:hypothetical protein